MQLCESVELVPVAPYYKETSFLPTLEAKKRVGGRDTERKKKERKKERTIIARVTLASKCIYCNFCNRVEKTSWSSDNIFSTAFLKP